MHRCPHALVDRRDVEVIQACAMVEHGVLPDGGGWQEQPFTFTQVYPLVMREISHWRQVARDKAVRDAETARKR